MIYLHVNIRLFEKIRKKHVFSKEIIAICTTDGLSRGGKKGPFLPPLDRPSSAHSKMKMLKIAILRFFHEKNTKKHDFTIS